MKKKYKIIYLLLFLAILMTETVLGQAAEDLEKGRIRIKLKREQLAGVSSSLKSATTAYSGSVTGIKNLDKVSDNVGITRINRVFPFSLKHEMKHRKYGLHLWIELEFDENINPQTVVDQFKGLDEVDIVKPVYKKVRMDSDKEAKLYKVEVISKASPKAVESPSATSSYTPYFNDPMLQAQWHYESDGTIVKNAYDIDLFEAWEQATGRSDIIVAIVDQGVDVYHEDLKANIWRNEAELNGETGVDDDQNGYVDDYHGYNFCMDGAITPGNHGTHVAGTVGAVSNNGIGVAGVAGGDGSGNGVKMISCQVFDYRSNGGVNFAQAIVYGADHGAVISQNSWGYNGAGYYEPEVHDAIKYFVKEAGQYEGSPMKGGIVVFAAGNDGSELDRYPAAFEETIAVTSLGPNAMPAAYTNFGTWASLAAPGGFQTDFGEEGGILSTITDDKYGYMDGTSMACPHVSGVAALAIDKFGGADFTSDDLERIMLNSTSRFIFQHNNKYGTGALNAANALLDDNRVAPEAITDLKASEIFHNEVRLEWTVPVDEDNGEPRYFYLAIGASEINDQNFDNQAQFFLQNELSAGETFDIKITGFQKLTDYWFAVKSGDQFDNLSDISNVLKVTTSNLPHFVESTRSVDVAIDVTQETTKKVQLEFSNIGDGIVYYNSTVRNEKYYWEPKEETNQEIAEAVQAKTEAAMGQPELFDATRPYTKELSALKSATVSSNDLSHWKNDNTEWVSGFTYQNTNPPFTLAGSGNANAGLIAATRFDIPYDYSINVTHLEVALFPEIKDQPIIIELKKGSKWVQESESVYMQAYYPDTTNVLQYFRIPLYKPQRFEDNEIFWVVMHFPKEMKYPLAVQLGNIDYGYFVMSRDNGVSYQNAQAFTYRPTIPMLSVLSSGDDGSYVFLDPVSGEIPKGETIKADVVVDATNLTEGKHLASLGIMTNDIHKPIVNIEVKVDVSGQLPEIENNKVHQFKAYANVENALLFDVHNKGLANLEVYDVISSTPGFSKAYEDTVVIKPDWDWKVPFSFTPVTSGLIENQVKLITNIGEINLNCEFSVVEAPVAELNASNVVDVVYGEKATLNLELANAGTGTVLEYDLGHYDLLNVSKGLFPHKLEYNILTSADLNGPVDHTWDDISDFAKVYSNAEVRSGAIDLEMNFPFFTEIIKNARISSRGQLYFYEDGLLLSEPESDYNGTGKGVLKPLRINDQFLQLTRLYFYSFGDRCVFSVEAEIDKAGNTPNQIDGTVEYQIVLFRNGAIEFRYKNVSDLQEDWTYTVGVQGLIRDDLLLYKDYEETGKDLYNGQVVRFEPTTALSLLVSATPAKGLINVGDNTHAELTIDPQAMGVTAGSYKNNVLVKVNTANKEVYWPLTINVTGTPELTTTDTLDFGTVKLGFKGVGFITASKIGSSDEFVETITFDHSAFSIDQALPLAIGAASKVPLKVVFASTSVEEVRSVAYLSFSDGSQKSVVLIAKGVEDASYDISINEPLMVDLKGGERVKVPFTLKNHDKGVPLEYTFKGNWMSYVEAKSPKRAEGNNNLGSEYGYWWNISDSIMPYYKWEDISSDAEILLIEQNEQQKIELPFAFPFFGEYYNSIWVSKNGYITVNEPESDHVAFEFEKDDGLSGMIAPFWSLLAPPEEGKGVFLLKEEERVILQWDNFTPATVSDLGVLSFQLEMLSDGTIHFHYKQVDPFSGGLQYGLESPDEEETVETEKSWILKWTILRNESTISFIPPLKDSLASGEQKELEAVLSAKNIYQPGVYKDTIELYTNSLAQDVFKIPVQLNVSGRPVLEVVTSLIWDDVIYNSNLSLKRKVKLINTGYDVMQISHIAHDQLDDLMLFDELGELIVKSSSGELLKTIRIEPWSEVELQLFIPVEEHKNVNGTISWQGNFDELLTPVTASIVDSPVFAWDAVNQSFSLNNTEVGEYRFTVKNEGETKLKYNLAPAVAPSGEETVFPVIIEEESNFSLNYPITVDSLNLEKKEKADGVLIPWIEGSNHGFSSRFTAPQGGFFLTHVKAFTCLLNVDELVRIEVSGAGENPQAGELLYKELYVVDQVIDEQWVFFPLEQPISIPEGEEFFVTVYQTKSTKYMGFENTTDESLKANSFTGNYRDEDEYYWWPMRENMVWKIRALTAAGEDSWIELDTYSGELSANESVEITAKISPQTAGKGEHEGQIIALCNDINNSKSDFTISLNANGAPVFKYYPNIYKDTLRVKETDDLLLNYLFKDPENETVSFTLDKLETGPQIEYEQTSNNTSRVEIKTDYDDEGIYSYPVQVKDASGSISSDTIVIKVENKNRPPVLNQAYHQLLLNMANPYAMTIDPRELFTDPDGDELSILYGNYTPGIFDLTVGNVYMNLNPLSTGTGLLAFGADDGKEDGFVVYGVYVQVIDDPDGENASTYGNDPDENAQERDVRGFQVSPNPVINGAAELIFESDGQGDVRIEVYNGMGQKLKVIENSNLDKGQHRRTLNFSAWSSGMYYCRLLQGGKVVDTVKVIVK
ncbi:MAG: S8 family serine peptidase [Carboxylicivirga sp.]|nr:S8 family serine peptidase [Carboxylicivirga sp.]